MRDKLTFAELRAANKRRQRDSFQDCEEWDGPDWGNALAGEAGELCNKIKKFKMAIRRQDESGKEELRRAIAKEIADMVIYADLVARYYQLDLGKLVRDKFNEVSERVGSKAVL